jgi:Holliday junction resolvase RusA-like endonuclease
MPESITLNLPYPISTNVMWRRSKFSTYLSEAGNAYKATVLAYVKENNIPSFGDSKVELQMVFHPRDLRKRDVSNCIKVAEDSLVWANVISDDYNVHKLSIERGKLIKGVGGLVVTVVKLD